MRSNFQDCLNKVLKNEGGYSNDKSDSGGPTNFGITISDVRRYVKKNATAQDVRNLSLNQAKDIYKSKYWSAIGCDDLPSGVDYTCFDYGVNSGIGRPQKALQRFKSLQGTELIDAINNERMAFLKALVTSRPKDQKYLRGWTTRVSRVRSYSKQLAQKNYRTGPIVGTTTLAFSSIVSYFSNLWHNHEYLVIGGCVAFAVLIGTIIHLIKNKGK